MTQPAILLIEDELHLRETLCEVLTDQGYNMQSAATVADAKKHLQSHVPDFAVVDVGLPDGNGFDLARQMMQHHPHLRVLFLTANSAPEDRLRGLEMGAVDYIAKPFHLKELVLRLRNLTQKKPTTSAFPEWIRLGRADIHFDRFLIRAHGEERQLSVKEQALLKLLWERSPAVVSRDDMIAEIWGSEGDGPTTRTIDNFIVRMRRWIEKNPTQPEYLVSVWGVGYSLRKDPS